MHFDADLLYQAVGARIKRTRKRIKPRVSQESLATKLGVSRASIVNIEAGRQHPPLDLLWRIAEALETEVTMLIPSSADFSKQYSLSPEIEASIDEFADGNATTKRLLSEFIGQIAPSLAD